MPEQFIYGINYTIWTTLNACFTFEQFKHDHDLPLTEKQPLKFHDTVLEYNFVMIWLPMIFTSLNQSEAVFHIQSCIKET